MRSPRLCSKRYPCCVSTGRTSDAATIALELVPSIMMNDIRVHHAHAMRALRFPPPSLPPARRLLDSSPPFPRPLFYSLPLSIPSISPLSTLFHTTSAARRTSHDPRWRSVLSFCGLWNGRDLDWTREDGASSRREVDMSRLGMAQPYVR